MVANPTPKPHRATVKPKRCKWCKGDFFPARPMQKVCSPACAHALTNAETAKKAAKAKALEAKQDRAKRIALKTIPELIAEAQHAFNFYVRLRDNGRGCISCGAPLKLGGVGGGFDCGHYRSRGAAGHLRFHEDNAHGQCKRCNDYLSGNVAAFRLGLIERIGQTRLDALEADNAPHKWTREELISIRDEYRAKARTLAKPSPDSGAQLGAPVPSRSPMPRLQGLTADIPPDLAHADELLTRYGRWAMDRLKIHRCGSAEGRFRPPLNESVEDDIRREPREVIMPTPDALAVHRALIRVAEVEREILQILYVPQRMRIEQQLRLKRIPGRLCQERHLRGLRMFANLMMAMQ